MRTFIRLFLLVFVLTCVGRVVAATHPALALRGGAPTLDGLLHDFLHALESKDGKALRRLRVTEREYRELIVPGNVAVGDSPQALSGEASEFYWKLLDEKSRYYEIRLLNEFGGETLEVRTTAFEKGHKTYAGHQAWKQLDLGVVDATGRERSIRTGSVVERDGRYKFVSFIRD